MIDILLLEDEETVNRGITFTLEREGYKICSCALLKEARAILKTQKAKLIICDLTLPDGNGLELVREIRKKSNAYIICLTALDQEIDQVMGYEAGADDYITKPFHLSILSLKVAAYLKRQQQKVKNIIESGELCCYVDEMRLFKEEKEIILTRNEWKLLTLFLNNPKQILSKNQLLEQLFDIDENYVDENTIAVNIRRLREKIEPDLSKLQYIKNIRGMGYIWDKECVKK